MAGRTITNPQGAYGYTDLETQLYTEVATFKAGGVVTEKAVVAIGTAGAASVAATDGTASLVVGIAQDAATTSGSFLVVVGGVAENVPCAGTVAAGDVLKRSVTTAGMVSATATPAIGEAIGFAINASSSNVVDVWVCKSL